MHGQTHTVVLILLEERLVWLEYLLFGLTLLNDCPLYSLSKLIKWVLILQP